MPEKNDGEYEPVSMPPKGFLTLLDDVTVGGGGDPYGGLGWSGLPTELQEIGKEARKNNFPQLPIT